VGKLKAGDAIDMVNGKPMANVEQFTTFLKNTKPGEVVTIDFRRKNEPPASSRSRWARTRIGITASWALRCLTRRGRRSWWTSTSPTWAGPRPG